MHSPITRNDSGGHVNAFEGKGYTSPKTMRRGDDGDLTIRHQGDPASSGFENFPAADQSDLSLGAPSAAKTLQKELGASVADSWGGRLRSLGRYVFGGR
jgi:hypothetical protein